MGNGKTGGAGRSGEAGAAVRIPAWKAARGGAEDCTAAMQRQQQGRRRVYELLAAVLGRKALIWQCSAGRAEDGGKAALLGLVCGNRWGCAVREGARRQRGEEKARGL